MSSMKMCLSGDFHQKGALDGLGGFKFDRLFLAFSKHLQFLSKCDMFAVLSLGVVHKLVTLRLNGKMSKRD